MTHAESRMAVEIKQMMLARARNVWTRVARKEAYVVSAWSHDPRTNNMTRLNVFDIESRELSHSKNATGLLTKLALLLAADTQGRVIVKLSPEQTNDEFYVKDPRHVHSKHDHISEDTMCKLQKLLAAAPQRRIILVGVTTSWAIRSKASPIAAHQGRFLATPLRRGACAVQLVSTFVPPVARNAR